MGSNKHSTLVTVSKRASQEVGTSANLVEGHTFSVWDLLHALMLPSGNDAAIALAEHFGEYLINKDKATKNNPFVNDRLKDSTTSEKYGNREQARSSSRFPEIKNTKKETFSDYTFSDTRSSAMYSSVKDKCNSFSFDRDVRSISCSEKYPTQNKKSMFCDSPKIYRFIQEMNKNSQKIGMLNTIFDSPHGLINKFNKSTAYDIALL